MRTSMHKRVAAADGPDTLKNANASVLKPGAQNPVKGPPKAEVKKGIQSTGFGHKGL